MQQNQEKQFTSEQIFAPNKQFPQRKFTLFKLAGQGTQGYIYLAQSENWKYNNKNLALKFSFKNQVSENELNFLKFIMEYQESEFEQKVPSDMIRVLDIFDFNHNNQDYLVTVMEQGDTDLYQYLKTNRTILTEIQKIKICLDITNPIYFLHQKQMLHRDIKPENYIQVDGKFKLIDFGLIKQSKRLQTIGVGTPIFQAPEIVEDSQNYTDKVDVWALACVFYEIFNEEALFNYVDKQIIKQKILSHKKDSSEVFQKIDKINCNQQFKQLIQNMLQPQVARRYDSSQVINCLKEIDNNMNQQQNSQIQQAQNSRLQTPFPQQINNNDLSNLNNSQSQVYQFEEYLIKQIKIFEEKTEKNSMELENKVKKMLEEKEQKQLELFKQIQKKQQELIEQNYQNHKQDINRLDSQLQVNLQKQNDFNQLKQKVDKLIQEYQEQTSMQLNQLNQDKTQQNQQISYLVNQVNALVQNQNQYLKKQEYQRFIESQKEENLKQQSQIQALQSNLNGLQNQITTNNTNFSNQLYSLKTERSQNQTFQQLPNTYNIEQVNLIIQNSLSESINKFQEQFHKDINKKLEVINDKIKQLNENQIPKNNILSKNEETELKFGQLESTLYLFMNKTENNQMEQSKNTLKFQFQIQSLQYQNKAFLENNNNNQLKIENQMKQNVDYIQSIFHTDINNLRNAQEITLQINQNKTSLEEQLKQEISQQIFKIQQLEQQFDQLSKQKISLELQNQQEQENNKIERQQFKNSIQNLNQKMDELNGTLNTQLTFVKNQLNFNQFQLQSCKTQIQKLNQGIEQKQLNPEIEDLQQSIKNQFTQEIQNIRDELKLEIQNQRQSLIELSQKFSSVQENELLKMNSQENNLNQFQKTIDELKQQYEQQTNKIQLVSQDLDKYQQELSFQLKFNQPQNQLQNEQLQKIEQNLYQKSQQLLQHEQHLQQLDYNIQYIYNYINQSYQSLLFQQQQCIQYLSNQMNENKENCEENCKKIKQDLQNKIKIQNEIIEDLEEKQSNQLNEFNDFKKQEKQIFKIIVKILQEIPNLQSEKVDQLNDHILGLLTKRQQTKVEQACQIDKVNEIQIQIGYEQYEHQQSRCDDPKKIGLINVSGQIQQQQMNEKAFPQTQQVHQIYTNQSSEIDQSYKSDSINREMENQTTLLQITSNQNDQLINDKTVNELDEFQNIKQAPNQFNIDSNQQQTQFCFSKSHNLQSFNEPSDQFQSNIDQIQNMDSTRQIYDSTQDERSSQQEKEQKITEGYEITSNQLNKEQENNCQVQSNEHLIQPENIQNEQQNFQEFKQNNDLNTMQNSKDNGEQQNIY